MDLAYHADHRPCPAGHLLLHAGPSGGGGGGGAGTAGGGTPEGTGEMPRARLSLGVERCLSTPGAPLASEHLKGLKKKKRKAGWKWKNTAQDIGLFFNSLCSMYWTLCSNLHLLLYYIAATVITCTYA